MSTTDKIGWNEQRAVFIVLRTEGVKLQLLAMALNCDKQSGVMWPVSVGTLEYYHNVTGLWHQQMYLAALSHYAMHAFPLQDLTILAW